MTGDLSVNPSKTVIVPFTRKRTIDIRPPRLNGTQMEFYEEVKYLGIFLDKKLPSYHHPSITLMWVPGHEEIEGNKKADELARKGAEGTFIGPEPFCGISLSHFKALMGEWIDKEIIRHQNEIPSTSHSKEFVRYSKKRAEQLLLLNRNDIGRMIGLLTGHCRLRSNLKRIGRCELSVCRLCLKEDETAKRILCECLAIARPRFHYFGEGFPDPRTVINTSPRKVHNFIDELRDLVDD